MARRLPIRVGDIVRVKKGCLIASIHTTQGVTFQSRFVVVHKPSPSSWVLKDPITNQGFDQFASYCLEKDVFLTQAYRANQLGPINHEQPQQGDIPQ